MAEESVILESGEGIATITMNRPASLNALDGGSLRLLGTILDSVARDGNLRVAIITGAGKAFVAGADIRAMAGLGPAEGRAFGALGQRIFRSIETLGKPVIAAVNGYALGGGLELALACDFIYASSTARLGLPETGLGLLPSFGGTKRLARLIGPARARELILTGKPLAADKALAWGLVNEVCAPEELLPKVKEIAAQIAGQGPRALALARESIDFGLEAPMEASLAHEAALFGLLFATADAREGMDAFLAKRKPAFTGD